MNLPSQAALWSTCSGPVIAVRCFGDNPLVKDAVESSGQGRALMVDGGASLRRALA